MESNQENADEFPQEWFRDDQLHLEEVTEETFEFFDEGNAESLAPPGNYGADSQPAQDDGRQTQAEPSSPRAQDPESRILTELAPAVASQPSASAPSPKAPAASAVVTAGTDEAASHESGSARGGRGRGGRQANRAKKESKTETEKAEQEKAKAIAKAERETRNADNAYDRAEDEVQKLRERLQKAEQKAAEKQAAKEEKKATLDRLREEEAAENTQGEAQGNSETETKGGKRRGRPPKPKPANTGEQTQQREKKKDRTKRACNSCRVSSVPFDVFICVISFTPCFIASLCLGFTSFINPGAMSLFHCWRIPFQLCTRIRKTFVCRHSQYQQARRMEKYEMVSVLSSLQMSYFIHHDGHPELSSTQKCDKSWTSEEFGSGYFLSTACFADIDSL